jgi:hypothetical protein
MASVAVREINKKERILKAIKCVLEKALIYGRCS